MTYRALRAAGFQGRIHLPGEERYELERLPWNRAFDPRPDVVAEATGPEDVRAAVQVARALGLPVSVQSTGHGTVSSAAGGLMLRTSGMARVTVDPSWRTATAGPGALWSDVIAAAAPYGLAPLSGTPWVGVTGYTLGGGAGWLSRAYGLAADSVVRADVVTADGEPLTIGPDEHPDLFWALRGGGGNFAVVTALTFRLYPVERVFAGMTLHPVERAADTLAAYRAWAPDESDESNTAVLVMRLPDGGRALGVRAVCLASAEEARRLLAPLLDAAGEPVGGGMAELSFAEAGTAIAGPPSPPMAVSQHFDLVEDLPDDLVGALLGSGARAVEVRHWGGAMARPGADAGPAGHRDVPFSVLTMGERVDLKGHATGGTFLNFLTDPSRTASAYTAGDHARLAQVKKAWDPDRVLRPGHAILPG
ncbi:FAD-binding oxidoreductase [Nonomuraea sp. NPDC000554]|uniref:FAD-binding oxidoreductase n=1 Tax=Nonomuraea sp. NPDC000554 TaxID=3154259 RepID=UPI003317CBFD